MKVLILGAAGQISRMVEGNLISETTNDVILYARNASKRVGILDPERERIVDGDFLDRAALTEAMQDVDVVYLNDMGSSQATAMILDVMKEGGVSKLIGATILGIYDEVVGPFGQWNQRMLGDSARYQEQKDSARFVENSGLEYTLLRLTWLYNEKGNEKYAYTIKGEPFIGAEVSRQAVARLIVTILTSENDTFRNQSLGVYEPGTEKYSKPSFY